MADVEYEDDFVSELTPSPSPSPVSWSMSSAASCSAPPPLTRQPTVSLSQFKQQYLQPMQKSSNDLTQHQSRPSTSYAASSTLSSNSSSSASTTALESRIATLEQELANKERELSQWKVKLRRAESGQGGGAASIGSPNRNKSLSNSSSDFGPNTAREIAYSSLTFHEQISGGGFCILYAGEWLSTRVAIKKIFDPVISAELLGEFNHEVSCLSNLSHPNVVQILAQVSRPPYLCIVTEFLARGSLYHVLYQSQVELNKQRRYHMSVQVINALNYLHHCGIVHRDIKPQNFLSDTYLNLKICDMGMARKLDNAKPEVGGTPNYMSPELYEGACYSFASDIWALGLVLNEIWCGEIPYEGLGVDEIRRHLSRNNYPKCNTIHTPREIVKIIQECLDKDSKKRPTIEKVMQMIKAYQC